MIPNPVYIKSQAPITEIKNKIVIFHGINLNNYYKKGNDIFEEALNLIKLKYSNRISIVTVKSIVNES